jgi:hypothetical protein
VPATATAEAAGKAAEGPEEALQTERYLQIHNATDKPVKVFLRYRTADTSPRGVWLPGDPETSKPFVFEVAPGQASYLEDNGRRITASRIRFWVESASGTWDEFKDKDLWLVPETDGQGRHVYRSREIETFPLRLAR